MLWRSVVGKLWFTILLLVSVVLTILMVLLLQSFERFHVNEAESQLVNHANMIAAIFDGYDEQDDALRTISQYGSSFETHALIFVEGTKVWGTNNSANDDIYAQLFMTNPVLNEVFNGEQVVATEGDFPLSDNGEASHTEMMVVGVPLQPTELDNSAVFLYQSLSAIEETSNETKQIVYFSAGIAIVLTTIFAFFLSSRITAPLRKMRQVALEVAQGQFKTKVPILTHDEIGQLAMAFNRMGRELNRNIHALNQEKEQLSRILVSMADGVITLDRKGQVIVTNPPAERFMQSWFYEQGINEDSSVLPEAVEQLFQRVVSVEKEQMIEIDVQGRSWAILMTPLYDREYVRGAVAVIRDMTEERRHDKLRKDFIANVSHELRTPVSMLQGYSEAIIDDIAGSEEDKKEFAKIIYDESLRMGRLVNELLDLARMEAGHIELHLEELELGAFSDRIVRKFQGYAKDEGVTLTLDHVEDGYTNSFDPDRIEQVLTNLIHNAIRHTGEKGRVTVKVRSNEYGVKFDVIDTGSGIPEEDLPYVFERFYKADKARTRARGGTGLGLAIAKNIVDAHKGQISVHSKIDEGTTFSFFIPEAGTEKDELSR
ncbi:cell wall metabolism sensor histidine kinase WalK [Alkalihalophilus marmarensis]|uniref:histidine kinase n=1 Tax=Alkalihalophilus marmarensis DSM 21297 TaxID=1188261 RepID=U6SVA0_9BACI|nr:ATP-binding protein [Alkalihalophilus marmarensis]ERN54581.1 sensor histidine kinase [Alkalihalophilus marmarensis DSM 21297]MCM3490456.1 cell wall metabolism sensor histidine kinase WalK [Alkalihalophilus marmarensis]